MLNLNELQQKKLSFLYMVGTCLLCGCAGSSVLVPNPRGSSESSTKRPSATEKSEEKPKAEPQERKKSRSPDNLDFAVAFADPDDRALSTQTEIPLTVTPDTRAETFYVPQNKVRVALCRNVSRTTVYSIGTVEICAKKKYGNRSDRGRIAIKGAKAKGSHSRVILETPKNGTFAVFLPCTLLTQSAHNYLELDEKSYRGSFILIPGKGTTFSIVNCCDVEDYLRGVVPLEIGKRSEEDIEAVKAQAVAARTYTYKKMVERRTRMFDVLPTIEDQVYEGVTVEYPLSDRAIRMTKDLVAVYHDSLIYAYYHSTCGGVTADISDVWGKQPLPYCKSIKDVDKNGKAYCAISNYFSWKESWNSAALSSILKKFSKRAFPGLPPFKGSIIGMTVLGQSPCGRVSVLRITSSAGKYNYGGDKIRFALRRNIAGYPILRSARFTVTNINPRTITITGRGYGHGVGMCQMGAIGRARAGHSFQEILKAYYTGIKIVSVTVDTSQKKLVYE